MGEGRAGRLEADLGGGDNVWSADVGRLVMVGEDCCPPPAGD